MRKYVARAVSRGAAAGWLALAIHVIPVFAAGNTAASDAGEPAFLVENGSAMTRMMKGMDITPSGNIDQDFVAMMAPHHQGAIDMAQAYLRFGHNEQLRRLAQEIIVEQQQEISAMRLAVGQPLPPPVAAPTQVAGPSATQQTMPRRDQQPEKPKESR